ncbi:energy-coupling factor transporter transmembrane component T family protein [Mycoplasma sp. SG1]|uniref:energy-coupling factor transporter transmembrane component T family protein n=1 Tax=Mycoplasma sp. SG1 TaxID=2810348 RepID=UPI00202495DC|nr:energy-coupling factor transporter transmembrane component T [Mycoplasma sp. SG1]URM52920.1 energy-coupling factor transporter transmembrane protein EcfT [Mycoplasma sp. SG1]
MTQFSVGVYIPLKSFIHRLDPRVKIISLILLMAAVFLYGGVETYIYLTVLAIVAYWTAKIPYSMILNVLKPLYFMAVILLIVNIIVVSQPKNNPGYFSSWDIMWGYIFHVGKIKVYYQAIWRTLYILWRILLMITFTIILSSTTSPVELTNGIESLLRPFKVIKLPTQAIAMMISISLRFIPTLFNEAKNISWAQASRGVDFKNGRFKEKYHALTSLIIPVFVSAFRKAEDLANSMDARGYDPYLKRTRFKQYTLNFYDVLIVLLIALILLLIIFTSYSFSKHHFLPALKWWDNLGLGEPFIW